MATTGRLRKCTNIWFRNGPGARSPGRCCWRRSSKGHRSTCCGPAPPRLPAIHGVTGAICPASGTSVCCAWCDCRPPVARVPPSVSAIGVQFRLVDCAGTGRSIDSASTHLILSALPTIEPAEDGGAWRPNTCAPACPACPGPEAPIAHDRGFRNTPDSIYRSRCSPAPPARSA